MADVYAGGTPRSTFNERTGMKAYDPNDPEFMNPDGSAKAPGFNSILDMNTGQLNPGFQYQAQTLNPQSLAGFQKYKGEALREGPSAWANLQNQNLELQRGNAIDKLGQQGDSSLAGALRALGSKGGVSAGSSALAASDMAKAKMMGKQGAFRDYQQGLNTTALEDEKNRVAQLGQFADAEAKLGMQNVNIGNEANKFNVGNSLNELGSGRDYNKFLYGEGMKKWASDRTATAMERAAGKTGSGGGMMSTLTNMGTAALGPMGPGGIATDYLGNRIGGDAGKALSAISNPIQAVTGGSWVCTKIHEAVGGLTAKEASGLFKLRRFSLKKNKGLASAYLHSYAPLTSAMEKAGIDFAQIKWFIDEVVERVASGKMEDAFSFYTKQIFQWISEFWPECDDKYYVKYIQTGEF